MTRSTKFLPFTFILSLATSALYAAEDVSDIREFFREDGLSVTPESYPIYETARQLLRAQTGAGVNVLLHRRTLTKTENQSVVRMNRDTYYSVAVIDVSGGASITLPDLPEGKYISMQPVSEDHRTQPMSYGGGTYELATHYGKHMFVIIRLDATFSQEQAAFYQDQIRVNAVNASAFVSEPVNRESFDKSENTLKARLPALVGRYGASMGRSMFTSPMDETRGDFVREIYEVSAAAGWGGAQWQDNIYEISGEMSANKCHQATFQDPKNAAFWSITVYDKNGFMFNDLANVSSNTAQANADGTFTVSIGCGASAPNNIPAENASGVVTLAVRHYQPSELVRAEGFRVIPYFTQE